MRTANIADLRNYLTRYLKEVRDGGEIIIRRRTPIAKIVPLEQNSDAEDAALVAAGLMRKGTGVLPASFWRRRRASLDPRVVADAVSRDRDED